MPTPLPAPARRAFLQAAAIAAALFCIPAMLPMPGIAEVYAFDFPHSPKLAAAPLNAAADETANAEEIFFGGFQTSSGESGAFELFACPQSGDPVRRLGRYNGRLAGVAITRENQENQEHQFLALTSDGALGSYGDNAATLCRPDDRWNMHALALWNDEPVALNLDNGALHLVRPGADQSWTQDMQFIADAGNVAQAELLIVKNEPHALWHSSADDLSAGEIRHAVLRDGVWTELATLPLGDLNAFSAHAEGGAIILAAHVRDVTGAGNDWPTTKMWDGETWDDASSRDRLPANIAEQLQAAYSFAAVTGGGDTGGTLWLVAGPDGAHTVRTDRDGNAGGMNAVAPGLEPGGIGEHLMGILTLAAMALALLLYCRRSKMMSRKFPSRPPDLISRGAALGVDWFLSSVATAAYHMASGDIRILPDLLATGDVEEMFWVNLIALCVFMGLSETLFGCTPGKWLAGLRVRNVRGGPPSFSQALFRNSVRLIDMYPVAGFPGLVGMVATLFGPGRQRIGDILSGTVVRRHADWGGRKLLLASKSPRRFELLRELGLEVRVQPPDIDEDSVRGDTPADTVRLLSQAKARAGNGAVQPGEIVVAADTVVVLDGNVLGKPADEADAVRMLTMLSGRSHSVYTGVTVWDSSTGQGMTDIEETEVEFRDLSQTEITRYVATGDPMDKAGAYGVQTGRLVKQIRGSLSNVAGLPMEKLQSMLLLLDS